MLFHEVAKGPVSASPSPTMHVVMRSGLSMTDPKATERQYPSSPPSWILPTIHLVGIFDFLFFSFLALVSLSYLGHEQSNEKQIPWAKRKP